MICVAAKCRKEGLESQVSSGFYLRPNPLFLNRTKERVVVIHSLVPLTPTMASGHSIVSEQNRVNV